jgi:hypothetical protein
MMYVACHSVLWCPACAFVCCQSDVSDSPVETSAQLWFHCLSRIATSGSGLVLTHPDNNQNRQDAAIALTFVRSRPDPNVAAHAPGRLCSAASSVHKNSYAEVSSLRRSIKKHLWLVWPRESPRNEPRTAPNKSSLMWCATACRGSLDILDECTNRVQSTVRPLCCGAHTLVLKTSMNAYQALVPC